METGRVENRPIKIASLIYIGKLALQRIELKCLDAIARPQLALGPNHFRIGRLNFHPSPLVLTRVGGRALAVSSHNPGINHIVHYRSEERREGKEWVSTCGSRWSPYH